MPTPIPQPAWFQPTWYAQQKFIQHNVMYPDDPWTNIEQYNQALASFNATNWENWFTEYGNAGNVSPNELFDESYYFTALAASSNAAHTNNKTDWNATTIKDYLHDTYQASGWDHYTAQGQFEGLNPSAQFDTNAYFQTRVNMLNAYNNGAGWDNHGWTVDMYKQVMRDAGINPIMDLYLNTDYGQPNATQTITAVANPLEVDSSWTPWGPSTPVTPVWVPDEIKTLTTGKDSLTGATGVETQFDAIVSSGATNTLNQDDQIHADANVENHLNVTMQGNFNGFTGVGGESGTTANLTGVRVVELTNNDNAQYYFNAKNTQGVQRWDLVDTALTSAINLQDLPSAGITVNIQGQKQGQANISFNSTAVEGDQSALTLGLNQVGQAGGEHGLPVSVIANGIENLTVNSTGTATNYVNLAGIAATTLNVTGSAPLNALALDSLLTTIDARGASGALYLDATGVTALKTAVLGSGNDTLVVKDIGGNSTIDGGAGTDTLVLSGTAISANASYNLTSSNLEVLALDSLSGGPGNVATFNGAYMNGLNTLNLNNCNASVVVENVNMAATTPFNVNIAGLYHAANDTSKGANITVDDVSQLNVTLGDSKTTTTDYYGNMLSADQATSMVLTLQGGSVTNPTTWDGYINTPSLTSLTVNSSSQYSSLTIPANPTAPATYGNDLDNLATLTLNGSGAMDFHKVQMGKDASNLQVSASNLSASFHGNFGGNSAVTNQGLDVDTGSGADIIKVTKGYSSIDINTGAGIDIVDLTSWDAADFANLKYLNITLGGNTGDKVYLKSETTQADTLTVKAAFQAASHFTDAEMDAYVTQGACGVTNDWANFSTGA